MQFKPMLFQGQLCYILCTYIVCIMYISVWSTKGCLLIVLLLLLLKPLEVEPPEASKANFRDSLETPPTPKANPTHRHSLVV